MKKKLVLSSLLVMLMLAMFTVTAHAGWVTTSAGKKYTEDGKKYYKGFHTIGGKFYYFDSKGIMAKGGWKTISDGKSSYRYYFKKNGVMRHGGIFKISKKYYYLADDGKLQLGYFRQNDATYYSDPKTGVLAMDKWIGGEYYFGADGKMATSSWINGKWVDADGKFRGVTNYRGFIKEDGITRYYDNNSKIVKGWLTVSGKTYYLNPASGNLVTGWFTAGNYSYYADKDGVVAKNTWNGKKYLTSTGAMAIGWATIGSNRYYFKTNGDRVQKSYKKIDGEYYYFDKNGVLATNQWLTKGKKKFYVAGNGQRLKGMQKVDKYYYIFSSTNGNMLKGWIKLNEKLYYANKKGRLSQNKWVKNGKYKYYAKGDCSMASGIMSLSGKLYYFDSLNRMVTKKKVTVYGATYYFMKDGTAAINKWKKIKKKYYYFGSNGKMMTNAVIGKYYVGSDGVRQAIDTSIGGWKTVSGKKYFYTKGIKLTGLQTISGEDYYFDSDGVMQTGIQTIDSKKYYFYPGGTMAKSISIAVSDKIYTINDKGVVTKETTIDISGSSLGAKIAKFAVKYVGNKYVYGGTSLTEGADCSGFTMTVFANFNIKLLRVADDQMKGPNATYQKQGYKAAVVTNTTNMLPGDLVFYGYGNYASHVGIYIGNGQIVHASNSQAYPAGGIKISNYNYQTPIKVVRYWS